MIAFKSCANSRVYSAFNARDFAVTVAFSMVKPISAKDELGEPAPEPKPSASTVDIPPPKPVPSRSESIVKGSFAFVNPDNPEGPCAASGLQKSHLSNL